jgi:hypothetical protein
VTFRPPLQRKVRSFSSDNWINCVWFECDKPGYELYKAVFHEHARTMRCDHPQSQHINYVFCSERHRQLFLHSHIAMGKLPPGYKGLAY